MPVDDEFASLALPPTTSRGRPHVGEALVLAGHASVHPGRVRPLAVLGQARATCHARASGHARRSMPSWAAGGIAVLAHSPTAPDHPEDVARLQDWGLRASRSTTERFDERYRGAHDRLRGAQRAAAHGRQRLPRSGRGVSRHGRARPGCPDAVGDGLLRALGAPTLHEQPDAADAGACAGPAARSGQPVADAIDARLTEFLTDDQVLPRFHVWTLGCQMNHSDSEEMAGALLAAGCAEADGLGVGGPRRHQQLCHPRGGRAEGHRPDGGPGEAQGGQPSPAGGAHGLLRARRRDGRPAPPLSRRGPVPAPRPGAGAGCTAGPAALPPPPRAVPGRHDPPAGRPVRGRDRGPPARHPRSGRRGGDHPAARRHARLAAGHLRLRQDLHLLHRALQPGTGAQPPVRRRGRRGPLRWPPRASWT